ncbi:MAG: metallophosphoesterase [Agriterribacter sp.]
MKKLYSRRNFIASATAVCVALQIPVSAKSFLSGLKKKVKLGIITDLHQDIMHDGLSRLQAFVQHMKDERPDALLQMGDFAYPGDKNKEVIELYKNAHQQVLHVIGNHDTDAGFTKEQCMSYWGMPGRYYTKDINGILFIILDGNDKGSPSYKGGYPAYVNEEQKSWLKQQLNEAAKPVIIVSHQPIAGPGAIDNAKEIQELLGAASHKILLAINGHTHIDDMLSVGNVTYVHINSASYFWGGDKYTHESYGADIHKEHPYISRTFPYRDALFALLTIDPAKGTVTIEGKKSEWVGASPEQLGYKETYYADAGKVIAPTISNRNIRKDN